MNAAGSSRSTPVTSGRPISKISASSMRSARLPVKVAGAVRHRFDRFGRAALLVHASHLLQRGHIGGAVLVGVHFGRRHDDEIAQLGRAGSSRETGTPPSTPLRASFSITAAASPGTRIVNSLKNVSLSTLTP